MLNLKLTTDAWWVKMVVEGNISEILTDHAYCEQKAASTAISLIVLYPQHVELVEKMADLAKEEMSHFQMVHDIIRKRGFKLGKERKDDYVLELMAYLKRQGKSKAEVLADKLLLCAMIEARSCERFKVLSENINDEELAAFYYNLMKSEARHYTMFIKLAKKLCPEVKVDEKWAELVDFEAGVIAKRGLRETVHG
ncbi:MAG: tRNA-(ms[2]io[6]A)-hydroxylase [Bacteroidia bacterium]|nr:tRNA-(ms[2]io[6]A)-hydroxylase [Bacteroidia bacterium]